MITIFGDFYPSVLEKGLRSERALKLAVAEMYVQGVSTRHVRLFIGSGGSLAHLHGIVG